MSRTRTAPTGATVNLLSPWVFDQMRLHRLRRRFVVGGITLVVLLAVVWTGLRLDLRRADADLRGEEATASGLAGRLARLSPVKTYVDQVQHRRETVHGAAYDDVAFSRVLVGLREATPSGATISSVSVDLAASDGSAATTGATQTSTGGGATKKDPSRGLHGSTCPGPDPFGTKVVVGCVTIEGSASDRETVGRLVIALGADKLFVEPFIDTTTTVDGTVTFAGSVGLAPSVFSGRYDYLEKETIR